MGMFSVEARDSVRVHRNRKNIIKLNLTALAIYQSGPLIEYERVTWKNQSFSVQLGYVTLPFGSNSTRDKLNLQSDVKKSGYTATVDYRFYLKSENKDPAPHGVYIGPYVSYYHFRNERDVTFTNSSGVSSDVLRLNTNVDVFNIGVQLGYQFVLGKRWTIDCILLAPSISNYKVKIEIDGNASKENLTDYQQEVLQALVDKYPALGSLAGDKVYTFNGRLDTWAPCVRYSIHLGFRF
jgi:hypothetical protein